MKTIIIFINYFNDLFIKSTFYYLSIFQFIKFRTENATTTFVVQLFSLLTRQLNLKSNFKLSYASLLTTPALPHIAIICIIKTFKERNKKIEKE